MEDIQLGDNIIFYLLQMEIPDLNFDTPCTLQPIAEVIDFYSLQPSQVSIQKESTSHSYSYQHNFKPIIQDEIAKKTMNLTWHSRYFVLTATRLLYYENSSKAVLKGCFNLASLCQYSLKIKEQQGKLFFVVRVKVEEEGDEMEDKQILVLNFEQIYSRLTVWKKQLNQLLQKIHTKKPQSPTIPLAQIQNPHLKIHGDNYWNRITITPTQIAEYASHLDIIFFRSRKTVASFHRFLMRSNFDHVGLLLRDSHDRLLILEAIESRGVWINEWGQMLPAFREHYEEIAIRKLIDFQQKIDLPMLENYLDVIIGKKYELSISKLLIGENQSTNSEFHNKKQKNSNSKIQNQQMSSQKNTKMNANKEKTYFCSELIADIYIKCGLIKGKKRNQFWPRDFEGHDLKLQSPITLSPLMYLQL